MAEATGDLGGNKIPNKSISVKKYQIASECSEQPIVKQATNEVKNQTRDNNSAFYHKKIQLSIVEVLSK